MSDSVSREAVLRAIEVHTLGQPWSVVRNLRTRIRALPAVEPECVARIGGDGVTAIETGSLRCGCRMHAVHRCRTRWSDMEASAKARTPAEPVSEAAVALAEWVEGYDDQFVTNPRCAIIEIHLSTYSGVEYLRLLRAYRAAKEAADAAVLRERRDK